jgi:hypothetical protein
MTVQRSIRLAVLLALAGAAAHAQGNITPALAISPSQPTTADHVLVHAVLVSGCPITFTRVERSGSTFTIDTSEIALSPCPPATAYFGDFDLGALPAGAYQVVIDTFGRPFLNFTVAPAPSALAFDGGRFLVTLLHGAVLQSGTVIGGQPAPLVQLTDESGYFWFFDSGNVEVTVKILDGTPVNNHFWLFAAGMTDRPFVLQVVDTQAVCDAAPCPPKLYANPAGTHQNIVDVVAFPH